jgi:hypothetical protein
MHASGYASWGCVYRPRGIYGAPTESARGMLPVLHTAALKLVCSAPNIFLRRTEEGKDGRKTGDFLLNCLLLICYDMLMGFAFDEPRQIKYAHVTVYLPFC